MTGDDFDATENFPGMAAPANAEYRMPEGHGEPEPGDGTSPETAREPTTVELEWLKMMDAQREFFEKAGSLAEEIMFQSAEHAEKPEISVEEKRRWHALACIAQTSSTTSVISPQYVLKAADVYARWLGTGLVYDQGGKVL